MALSPPLVSNHKRSCGTVNHQALIKSRSIRQLAIMRCKSFDNNLLTNYILYAITGSMRLRSCIIITFYKIKLLAKSIRLDLMKYATHFDTVFTINLRISDRRFIYNT